MSQNLYNIYTIAFYIYLLFQVLYIRYVWYVRFVIHKKLFVNALAIRQCALSIEFTCQKGNLYFLNVHKRKKSTASAVSLVV